MTSAILVLSFFIILCLQIVSCKMEIPYSSPVPINLYPYLGTGLMLSGLACTAGFFVYQMHFSGNKTKANLIFVELLIGLVASILLGFGSLFFMLSFGLYI